MVKTQEEYRQILEQRLDEAGLMKKVGLAAAGLAAVAGIGYGVSKMGGSKPAYDPHDAQFDRIERRQDAAVNNMKSDPNNLRQRTAGGEVWSNKPMSGGHNNTPNKPLKTPVRGVGVPSGQGVQMDTNDM